MSNHQTPGGLEGGGWRWRRYRAQTRALTGAANLGGHPELRTQDSGLSLNRAEPRRNTRGTPLEDWDLIWGGVLVDYATGQARSLDGSFFQVSLCWHFCFPAWAQVLVWINAAKVRRRAGPLVYYLPVSDSWAPAGSLPRDLPRYERGEGGDGREF